MEKNKQTKIGELYKQFTKFKIDKTKNSQKKLLLINTILLILIFIISTITSKNNYITTSIPGLLITIIIGIPTILLILYGLLHLFLGAFEPIKQKFTHGYLTFSFIALNIILLGNTTNLLITLTNGIISKMFSIILFLILIYGIINLTINLKKYFKISYSRIILCKTIVLMLFGITLVIEYLIYLLSLINK